MDLNLVVLCGRLAREPEIRRDDSQRSTARLLVTVRSELPHHRVDLVPVLWPDPTDEVTDGSFAAGSRVWVTGYVQRRFWEGQGGGRQRSRLELVAHRVEAKDRRAASASA